MSDSPRTDKASWRQHDNYLGGERELVTADFARTLERENARMREMLLRAREEFCWHGNTGNRLSVGLYGDLVDMIDAALKGEGG